MAEPMRQFLGWYVDQNSETLPAFARFFEKYPPARIIELGTYHGGLSLFLHLYCMAEGRQFVTYDKEDQRDHPEILDRLEMDFRLKNIFLPDTIAEIAALIQEPGLTVLLCDDGNKVREFRTFSPFLKMGDFVMVHDFGHGRQKRRGIAIWDTHVEEVAPENGLERTEWSGRFFDAKWLHLRRVR